MPDNETHPEAIDWSLTTWDGTRREQLRRWAALTLEEILLAQEEMQELAEQFAPSPRSGNNPSAPLGTAETAAPEEVGKSA